MQEPFLMHFSGMKQRGLALLAFLLLAGPVRGIEVPQLAGTAHAFPAMYDLNGKKIADGEYVQQVQNGLLQITITYDLKEGGEIEESGAFRQRAELEQKSWSWREQKNGALQRRYHVDFDSGKATAQKREHNGLKEYSDEVKVEPGRTFAGFGFTLALANLRARLVRGEAVELKAVGFTPKPRVVTVKLTSPGIDEMRMSGRLLRAEHFLVKPEIPAIAKLFVKIPDTNIWLTPPPSGFLRWEGPLAEPSDPLVRVDFSGGGKSGPAKAIRNH